MSKKKTTKEFIENSESIFGKGTFIYSKTNYISNKKHVILTCPIHGDFIVRPDNHLFRKSGCPYCSGKHQWTTEEFIKRANEIYDDKYDYSKTNYIDSKTKVIITCHKHGDFEKYPNEHIKGAGCPICTYEKMKNMYLYDTETFIEKSKLVHGDKYSYDCSNYIDSHSSIDILCKKHGIFSTKPYMHLQGQGCPKCNQSHLETEIETLLTNKSIKYINSFSPTWLCLQHLDFYLPEYNIAIECQGEQHYEPVELFGGKKEFYKAIERDTRKARLCKENGVKLLYFTHYSKIKEEDNIYKNKDKLLEEILHNAESV